jgi:RNA polymerase sigma factor (sigma-70 family)
MADTVAASTAVPALTDGNPAMVTDGDFSPSDEASLSFIANATNIDLLSQAKQYLEAQLKRQAPDTVLTLAWNEFYGMYSKVIQRFVLAQGLRGADADDCVQEVWSTVAQKLTDFERPPDRPGLRAWLYTVVRSKTNDYLRRALRRTPRNLDAVVSEGLEPSSREPDPAAALEQQWHQALIRTAISELRNQLSEVSYQVLVLRLLEELSEVETATALNITPEQVRYRKHRAQMKLHAMLSVYTGKEFG